MSEVTVPQTLSGEEIMESVLDRVRKMLLRDCYMNPVSSYDHFTGTIKIELKLHDSGREAPVNVTVPVEEIPSEPPKDVFLQEAEYQFGGEPPNEVRQEAGLGIPTLVVDSEGRGDIKKVKYAKPNPTKHQI